MDLVLVYAADSFSVALFARAADRSIERLILAFWRSYFWEYNQSALMKWKKKQKR